jgi:hypothetical protein
VLTANRAVLDAIAEALIRVETLDRAELMTLIKAHAAPGRGPVALAHNDATPHAEAAAAASRGQPQPGLAAAMERARDGVVPPLPLQTPAVLVGQGCVQSRSTLVWTLWRRGHATVST